MLLGKIEQTLTPIKKTNPALSSNPLPMFLLEGEIHKINKAITA
jgi:hypothetical protein